MLLGEDNGFIVFIRSFFGWMRRKVRGKEIEGDEGDGKDEPNMTQNSFRISNVADDQIVVMQKSDNCC